MHINADTNWSIGFADSKMCGGMPQQFTQLLPVRLGQQLHRGVEFMCDELAQTLPSSISRAR